MSGGLGSKLWRRTRVGGLLALGLALLLWASTHARGADLVLAIGLGLAAWIVLEAAEIGALGAGRPSPGRARESLARPFLIALLAVGLALVVLRRGELPWASRVRGGGPAGEMAVVGLAGLGAGLLAARLLAGPAIALRRAAGAILWLVLPLPLLFLVRLDLGVGGLTCLLVLSKIGDVAAYYVGSTLGRRFPHHPFPRVSPNKTSVGCLASLVAGAACGALLARSGLLPAPRWGVLSGLGAGAVVNLAAQAGDLLESRVKREVGVKDSAATFGPSGGMLDLCDSLLCSVPAALVAWPWLLRWPLGATG